MDEEANNQVFEWQNVIMAFCFSSALQIAILSAETKKELSPSFCVLSFSIFLTFLFLFVSKLTAHKFAAASQALEKAAIVVAATTLVLATTIPYVANSAKLKYAAWALYAFSLLTIFVCNFIDEIVKLIKKVSDSNRLFSCLLLSPPVLINMFDPVNPETTIYPNEFKLPCKAEAEIPFVFDEYILCLLLMGSLSVQHHPTACVSSFH